jgi:hypothetical protein
MTVSRLGRCGQQQYAWLAKVFHQPSFLARHSYSPLAAGSFGGLSSPAVE